MAKTSSAPKGNDLSKALSRILADTYALAVKTHGAHWNVTGPAFFSLHEAFSVQYLALFEAADDIAERLRALGASAPSGIAEIAGASTLPASPSSSDGVALAGALAADHRSVAKACREGVAVAQAAGDEPSADLLIGRAEAHEKTAWMLGAAAT
ncbi:MAG TPA: DNA starvation/stationary phase protection protein [Planctomycetota bacterium]|nr:DNA starvation/stationary phase protection protein [Planctomycetota bacterium]